MKRTELLIFFCLNILLFLIQFSSFAQSFPTTISVKKTYCNRDNGVAKVIPSSPGRYTYAWSTGSIYDSTDNLAMGQYFVTVTKYDSITSAILGIVIDTAVIDTQHVLAILVSKVNPFCGASNGVINIGGTGGTGSYTFEIVKAGVSYGSTGLGVGTYKIVVVDNLSGCISDSVIAVLIDTGDYFSIIDTNIVGVNCFNEATGSIRLTLTGGERPYSYNWTGSSSTDSIVTGLRHGTYFVHIHDALCPTIRTFSFIVPGPSDSLHTLLHLTNDTCLQHVGEAIVSNTGGTFPYTYRWSDNTIGTSLVHLSPGNYYVNVQDNKGCKDSVNFKIRNVGGPSAHISQLDSVCPGINNGKIRIKTTSHDGPFHYSWNFDPTRDTNYVRDLSTGNYSVTITNQAACDTVISITLSNFYLPTLETIGDTTILQGQYAKLEAVTVSDYDSIYWLPNQSIVSVYLNAIANPLHSTNYTVYVRYKNGCYLSDSVMVMVDSVELKYIIPNVFSPNNDGINDILKLNLSESVKSIEMHIFDRWGNKIFDSFDKTRFWDGKNQSTGLDAEVGVYSYFAYIQSLTETKKILVEGNITLLR